MVSIDCMYKNFLRMYYTFKGSVNISNNPHSESSRNLLARSRLFREAEEFSEEYGVDFRIIYNSLRRNGRLEQIKGELKWELENLMKLKL